MTKYSDEDCPLLTSDSDEEIPLSREPSEEGGYTSKPGSLKDGSVSSSPGRSDTPWESPTPPWRGPQYNNDSLLSAPAAPRRGYEPSSGVAARPLPAAHNGVDMHEGQAAARGQQRLCGSLGSSGIAERTRRYTPSNDQDAAVLSQTQALTDMDLTPGFETPGAQSRPVRAAGLLGAQVLPKTDHGAENQVETSSAVSFEAEGTKDMAVESEEAVAGLLSGQPLMVTEGLPANNKEAAPAGSIQQTFSIGEASPADGSRGAGADETEPLKEANFGAKERANDEEQVAKDDSSPSKVHGKTLEDLQSMYALQSLASLTRNAVQVVGPFVTMASGVYQSPE